MLLIFEGGGGFSGVGFAEEEASFSLKGCLEAAGSAVLKDGFTALDGSKGSRGSTACAVDRRRLLDLVVTGIFLVCEVAVKLFSKERRSRSLS